MKRWMFLLMAASACGSPGAKPDAYGQFEAVEVVLSAETAGPVVRLLAGEGDSIRAGMVLAVIDTVPAQLKQQALDAQRAALHARKSTLVAQFDVQQEQFQVARREQQRVEKLFAEGAATEKQRDDANGQVRILQKQTLQIQSQIDGLSAEFLGLDAQQAAVRDQFRRSTVRSPVNGIVLTRYVETGELAAPGKALFSVTDATALYLKAFVSGDQLASITAGDSVTIQSDGGNGTIARRPGRIVWISSKAEFTPKIIQTRNERTTLVYAIKVTAGHRAGLQIGMPGEVVFSPYRAQDK